MKKQLTLALLATVIAATGCTQHPEAKSAEATVDQSNLCEVNSWQHDAVASSCKPGQKVVFLPQSFGNEQLPIIFAAVNCDLRYHVALTTGAVTCIYNPITPSAPKSEPPASAAKP